MNPLDFSLLADENVHPEFTIEMLETIAAQTLDVRPPFIVVAARSEQTVRIRVRQL